MLFVYFYRLITIRFNSFGWSIFNQDTRSRQHLQYEITLISCSLLTVAIQESCRFSVCRRHWRQLTYFIVTNLLFIYIYICRCVCVVFLTNPTDEMKWVVQCVLILSVIQTFIRLCIILLSPSSRYASRSRYIFPP